MSATSLAVEVPFVDLQRQHESLAPAFGEAFERVLASGAFVLGEEVEAFESGFADLCGVAHCVGVGSGTAALTLALLSAGIGEGDEVIVPAHTYIATALAVVHAGATPVFCDVKEGSGLIDTQSAGDAVTSRTAAILPVHLYGQVCEMKSITALAHRHGLLVVEDAAQAHGAQYRGQRAGSFGHLAAFSFYPSKNLGALGDGGAICTDDEAFATKARRLRNLGQASKGEHVEAGFNERLHGLQAAMLRAKLPWLDESNDARRAWASLYRAVLPDRCEPLEEEPGTECVYHLFPVRVDRRDEVREQLARRGIDTGVHYWPTVPNQGPFADRPMQALPAAERWSEQELSLPMFPELQEYEVHAVAEALTEIMEELA